MLKKFLAVNLAIVFISAGFFCWGNIPGAKALSSTNASADIVIGQPDMTSHSANQGGANAGANTMKWPNGTWTDGKKLFVADIQNNRVLIYNSMPTSSNASADVVIGQPDMTSHSVNQGGSPAANTLEGPYYVSSDGVRLFVADTGNNRILIYNSIPASNGASADIVIGQADFTHNDDNQGGSVAANTLVYPYAAHTDGTKLFIADGQNNRVLIYNSIPASNGASADVVVGQADFTHDNTNQGGAVAANTLDTPSGVNTYDGKMYVTDAFNSRVLIFNSIPASNNASADIVIGQPVMTSHSANQGGADPSASTLGIPFDAFTDGSRLYVSDYGNSRVLIYNSLPTASNPSADTVIGQPDFSSNLPNQGGAAGANTLAEQAALYYGAGKLFVGDPMNNRLLIYLLDASVTWQNNKSKSFSGGIKGRLTKKSVTFSGKKTTVKKGRVYVYRNGVLKKSVKIKKNGAWKLTFSERQRNVDALYYFRFYSAANRLVSVSDQLNVYLGRLAATTKNTLDNSENTQSVGAPKSTGADNAFNKSKFNLFNPPNLAK